MYLLFFVFIHFAILGICVKFSGGMHHYVIGRVSRKSLSVFDSFMACDTSSPRFNMRNTSDKRINSVHQYTEKSKSHCGCKMGKIRYSWKQLGMHQSKARAEIF